MLLDEIYLSYIREQIKGAHTLLIQEQGGEDEDNFNFLEKAMDKLNQVVLSIDSTLDNKELAFGRMLRETTYEAVENYANICRKLDEEGASIYDDPQWKAAESAIITIGEKIMKRKASEENPS